MDEDLPQLKLGGEGRGGEGMEIQLILLVLLLIWKMQSGI